MTIKNESFHEREDNLKKPKRPRNPDNRNLRNALRSNDIVALLEYTDDEVDEESYSWKS